VEELRKYTLAWDLLAGEMGNLSLGKHLSLAIRSDHYIHVGSEMLAIKDGGFRVFLAHYFQALVPLRLASASSSSKPLEHS
jgi:hypothetical protein